MYLFVIRRWGISLIILPYWTEWFFSIMVLRGFSHNCSFNLFCSLRNVTSFKSCWRVFLIIIFLVIPNFRDFLLWTHFKCTPWSIFKSLGALRPFIIGIWALRSFSLLRCLLNKCCKLLLTHALSSFQSLLLLLMCLLPGFNTLPNEFDLLLSHLDFLLKLFNRVLCSLHVIGEPFSSYANFINLLLVFVNLVLPHFVVFKAIRDELLEWISLNLHLFQILVKDVVLLL